MLRFLPVRAGGLLLLRRIAVTGADLTLAQKVAAAAASGQHGAHGQETEEPERAAR
jgi:hypothetical protein